jgi:hypothetical protein
VAPDAGTFTDPNEFTVRQPPATGELFVSDYLFTTLPTPVTGEQMGFVQGILELRNTNSKLEPRGDTDLQRPVQLLSFGPTGQFTREGAAAGTPTFPQALKVGINSAQSTDTTITLVSGDPTHLTVSAVVVPAGSVEAIVPVQGITQALSTTVTAMLGSTPLTATVRVLGAAEVPVVASLTPNPLLLPEDGTADLTLSLDIPPAVATSVSIDADAGFATVPASVTVPANQLTAPVRVVAAAGALGNGTVTATLGGSMATCNVTISNIPSTNHVVISELTVVGPGGASDEFVELYNPTGSPVDMSSWHIQYKSATGAAYQNEVTLPQGAVIASHGYYLIASGGTGGYSGNVPADFLRGSALAFAAAGGHVRIGPASIGTAPTDPSAVDTIGYGTGNTPEGGGMGPPAPTAGQSLERKASSTATAATMAPGGADALFGNALDTDSNAADFVVRAVSQPQNRASGTEP